VASITLISPAIAASSKVFFTNDLIGPAQAVAGSLPTGNFSAFLSVLPSATASLKRFTIEVFLCDNAGVIIPQAGPPSTDPLAFYAGKNTVVILDSGNLTLPASNTSVGLSGYLTTPINVAVGQRFRYHISVARGAGGGAQTMNVNIGNTWNSYIEAPIPLTTSTVINTSLVPGATATDALNALFATSHSPVTIGTANGLSLATQTLSLALASTSTTGALSSTDWNTFNNKQPLLTNPITGTGIAGQVTFWSGVNSQAGDNSFTWDNTNKTLNITGNGWLNSSSALHLSLGPNKLFNFIGNSNFHIANNAIYTGSAFNYVNTGPSSKINIESGGGILFDTAPSGTAATVPTYTNRMAILNNGNIGIGNINPIAKLQVSGNNSAPIAYFHNNSGTAGTVNGVIIEAGTNATDYALNINSSLGTSYFKVRGDGNVGIGIIPQVKLDVNGAGGSYADSLATLNTNSTFRLKLADSTLSLAFALNSANGGTPLIQSYENVTNPSRNLLLNPYGGNVGIGTPTPSSKLEIVTPITNDGITFRYNPTIGNSKIGVLFDTGDIAGNVMTFNISNTASVAVERMRIRGDGNVGIGTLNPTEKLHVVGNIKTTAGLTVDGASTLQNQVYLGSADPSVGITFMQAIASDLVLGCRAGTRVVEIRNGNYATPNYNACGIHTGSGQFDGNVQATTYNGVKSFKGLGGQVGTNAPSFIVLSNSLSGNPVWTRTGVGTYRANLTGAFIANKVFILITEGIGGFVTIYSRISNDVIEFYTSDPNGNLVDNSWNLASISIEVHP
jgi:hypothetical protein